MSSQWTYMETICAWPKSCTPANPIGGQRLAKTKSPLSLARFCQRHHRWRSSGTHPFEFVFTALHEYYHPPPGAATLILISRLTSSTPSFRVKVLGHPPPLTGRVSQWPTPYLSSDSMEPLQRSSLFRMIFPERKINKAVSCKQKKQKWAPPTLGHPPLWSLIGFVIYILGINGLNA